MTGGIITVVCTDELVMVAGPELVTQRPLQTASNQYPAIIATERRKHDCHFGVNTTKLIYQIQSTTELFNYPSNANDS